MTVVVILTMVTTASLSGIVFRILLRAALRQQQEELSNDCHDRFGKLISEMNHAGEIPDGVRLLGMAQVTSLAIGKITKALEELYRRQDYDTQLPTSELHLLSENELKHLITSASKWLEKRREILRQHDKDQGI